MHMYEICFMKYQHVSIAFVVIIRVALQEY